MGGLVGDALLQLLQRFHNPELVGSLLLLYVLHVVGFTVNIPQLVLNGLKVIVAPTEEAVLRIRSDATGPRPEPLGQLDREGKEANAYDKMNALGLARMEVSRGTLGSLMYFPHYEGMVWWAIVAVGNFIIAQGSRCAIPTQSPLGWASFTLCVAFLRALWCNVRLLYLLGLDNDHSKFALLCGFCGLFASAATGAMSPAAFFAFDIRAAAVALHAWGARVAGAAGEVWGGSEGVGEVGIDGGSSREASGMFISEEDFVALCLPVVAVVAACVTAAAALPAIRFAQYFNRALGKGSGASFLYRVLLVADAILPWLATLVWITAVPPIVSGERWGGEGGHGQEQGASVGARVGVTWLAALARFAVGRLQLQAYLDGVKESVLKELREKKVDVQTVRSKFDARFQYFVIAAAQYAAPALTVLFSLAVFVHIGGSGDDTGVAGETSSVTPATGADGGRGLGLGVCDAARRVVGLQPWDTALADAAAGAAEATNSGAMIGLEGLHAADSTVALGVFLAKVPEFPWAFWSGVAGFFAWWACLSWAVTYAVGVGFWLIFPEDVSAVERTRSDTTTKRKREKAKGKAKTKGGSKSGGASVKGSR